MKKSISKLFGLAALSLVAFVTSCSSDDNGGNPDPSTFELVRDDFKGEIEDGTVTLESGTYKLTGKLIVNEGAKLVIKAGVTIEAASSTTDGIIRYIAVAQGGEIHVQGTASAPVVMTSVNKTPGSWGGLVLCGRAPINKGIPATAEVSELAYGGNDSSTEETSGSIRYLRIEYSGYSYNNEKEFNGLSMFGVGKGTILEYIQVYEGSDDGFEWFGGNVDAKYLIVTNNHQEVGDDLFDWTEGWNGMGENWYGIRTNGGNRGIEADNNSNNHMASPISNPTIKNLTLIGNNGGGENHAIKLRVGTKAQFDNVVLSNFGTGFDIQHDESVGYVANGQLRATNVKFDNITTWTKGSNTDGSAADVSGVYTENANATGAGSGTVKPTWANGWALGL